MSQVHSQVIAKLRHRCAGSGAHEHDGCSCSDEELGSREMFRLREALVEIASSDDVDNALDPERNKRIARAALTSLPDEWESAARAAGWRRRYSHFTNSGVSVAYVDWRALCLAEGIEIAKEPRS